MEAVTDEIRTKLEELAKLRKKLLSSIERRICKGADLEPSHVTAYLAYSYRDRIFHNSSDDTPCAVCGVVRSCLAAISGDGRCYPICGDCYDPIIGCDICGTACSRGTRGEEAKTMGGLYLCASCYGKHIYECDGCHRQKVVTSNTTLTSNGRICVKCASKGLSNCALCGSLAVRASLKAHRGIGDICRGCRKYQSREIGPTRTASTRGKMLTSLRTIGVEIEAEGGFSGYARNNIPSDCGIGSDGTLQNGVEVQTNPTIGKLAEETINQCCRALKDAKYTVSSRCGLHVHVGAFDIRETPSLQLRLARAVYALEPIFYAILPDSRQRNNYCRRLSDYYKFKNFSLDSDPEAFSKAWYNDEQISSRNQRKGLHGDETRYMGFNLHSVFYRGTVEFRHHSGTLNPKKIIYWTKLICHIIDWVADSYNDDAVVAIHKKKSMTRKINLMFEAFDLPENLQKYIVGRYAKFGKGRPPSRARSRAARRQSMYQRVVEQSAHVSWSTAPTMETRDEDEE